MKKQGLWLVGMLLAAYVLLLGVRPLFIADETRYAEIPREMRASGNWVVPRFNGWDYFEKPVLGYWLIGISQEVFGETPFAVRFPGVLAAGVSALSIWLFLKRRGKDDPLLPGLACALFLMVPMVFGCATYAVLDGPFSAFLSLAMVLFFLGEQENSARRRRAYHVGFGLACGLAFLAKGLLGFVLPVLVIVPYMLWRRKTKDLLRFPWIPLLVAGLVILPWAVAVQMQAPDFWRFFIWHEHFQRFFDAGAGQHIEPFWFFVPVLLGGAFPLMVLLPAAVSGLRREGKTPLVVFCLFWFGMLFAFFSMSSGKLGTYILPCFPPLAVLIALGSYRYLQSGKRGLFDAVAKGFGILLLIALWGFAALHVLPFPSSWKVYSLPELGRLVLGVVAVLFWGGALLWSAHVSGAGRKLRWFAAGPVLVLALFPLVVPNLAYRKNAPLALLERNVSRVSPDSLVFTSPYLVGASDWAYQRADAWLMGHGGELMYGMEKDSGSRRLISLDDTPEFIAGQAGTGRFIFFIPESVYDRYEKDLPEPRYLDRSLGFVWAQY